MQATITEREAKSRFTEILNAAQESPVAITKDGKETVFMLSSDEYEKYREYSRWEFPGTMQEGSAVKGPMKEESGVGDAWDELVARIDDIAIDTGISDLAHNHDHYLFGLPKK